MTGFVFNTKIFKVVGVALLLIVAMGATAAAQSLNPIPWPTPPAVPPAPSLVNRAQTVAAGFDMTGFIQYASLDPTPGLCNKDDNPPAALNVASTQSATNPPLPNGCKITAGWITVNNTTIRIPQNVVVVFPNTYLTWEEVFEFNPNVHQTDVVFQSGLAMADINRLPGTFEVHVQGNIVNGNYMAGIVYISQQAANFTQGFIEKINYADSSIQVNGMRVKLNDPMLVITDRAGNAFTKGRYTAGQNASLNPAFDPRFTVDQNNPTVTSHTGYPMCIPVVAPGTYAGVAGVADPYFGGFDDPQCPEINRPRDLNAGLLPISFYTMNAPGAAPEPGNPNPQDPYTEAPFEVGDFVDIIGTNLYDPTTPGFIGPFLSATSLQAFVAIYTAPSIDPAYVLVETTIMGTGGNRNPNFPQEAGVRTRVEGFSTDPDRNVDISAIDYDCNGNVTFRQPAWAPNFPIEQGVPGIGVRGRWRFRAPQGGNFLPPVQNIGARIGGGIPEKNNSGLTTDEYQLPTGTFIFPENLFPGNLPPTANLNFFPFLVNGTGPWPPASDVFDSQNIQLGLAPAPGFPNQVIGQLNPFPDMLIPPMGCVPGSFVSVARPTYTSVPKPPIAGTIVTLDGSTSTPPTGPFAWSQIINPGDPIVTISNPSGAQATFVAPLVLTAQSLTFGLVVGPNAVVPQSQLGIVTVPVQPPPPGTTTAPTVTATASPAVLAGDGASIVTLSAFAVDPAGTAGSTVTFAWTAPAGSGIVLTPASPDGSVQTFVVPFVPAQTAAQVFTFTVTGTSSVSGAVGTGTVTVTVNPSTDTIIVNLVTWRSRKSRLLINVSDFTPGVTLTATLPNVINQATGQPWSGVMGPIVPFVNGVYQMVFSNVPFPEVVVITSSAGGTATSGVTVLH